MTTGYVWPLLGVGVIGVTTGFCLNHYYTMKQRKRAILWSGSIIVPDSADDKKTTNTTPTHKGHSRSDPYSVWDRDHRGRMGWTLAPFQSVQVPLHLSPKPSLCTWCQLPMPRWKGQGFHHLRSYSIAAALAKSPPLPAPEYRHGGMSMAKAWSQTEVMSAALADEVRRIFEQEEEVDQLRVSWKKPGSCVSIEYEANDPTVKNANGYANGAPGAGTADVVPGAPPSPVPKYRRHHILEYGSCDKMLDVKAKATAAKSTRLTKGKVWTALGFLCILGVGATTATFLSTRQHQ